MARRYLCLLLIMAILAKGAPTLGNRLSPKLNPNTLIGDLERQIQNKEHELENAETVNRNFERMLQLVSILGQVDNFLTDRTKAMIKKLAVLVDDEKKSLRSHSSQEDD